MKALTIKEPWASLIINGYKKYEFRTWKTNYRGKILIHAGSKMDKKIDIISKYNLDYKCGYILGEVELIDCILVDGDFNKKLIKENSIIYGNDHIGDYAWVLGNNIKYENPKYVKGKLGLWNYDD